MRAALVGQQADVAARVLLAQRRRELVDPGLPGGLALGPLAERGEVDHDPAGAVGERGRVGGHPSHRPAQHPQLRRTHGRVVGGLQALDDRLSLPVSARGDARWPVRSARPGR
jgi:hypothetical protein